MTAQEEKRRLWGVRAALVSILWVAFGLRVFGLGSQELRGDEAFGYFFSLRSFFEMVQDTLRLQEPHPLASYVLQHLSYPLFGKSEFALRLPSAFFGVLAVALLYRLAGRLKLGARGSVWAAALLAVNAYALWHSQDARMYSMSLALTLAGSVLAVDLWRRPSNTRLAGYVASMLLALHTHYFAVFVLIAHNLYWLLHSSTSGLSGLFPRLRSESGWWLSAQVVIGALYAPWLWLAWPTLHSYRGNGDSPDLISMLVRSLGVFAVGETTPIPWRTTAASVVAFLWIGASLLWLRRRGQAQASPRMTLLAQPGVFLALYLVVPLLATWVSAQSRPIFNERYLIAALPPFLLLFLLALREMRITPPLSFVVRWLPAALVVMYFAANLVSASNLYSNPAYSKNRGWRELAAALVHWTQDAPPEIVRLAQNFPDPVLWYYYAGAVEHAVLPPGPNDEAGARSLVQVWTESGVRRVLLPVQLAPNWDPTGIGSKALAERYRLAAERQVGVWPLQLYARPAADGWTPVHVGFENGVRLERAQVETKQLHPTGVLVVHLAWSGAPGRLAGGEKIFLHLVDSFGKLISQFDPPLDPAALQAPSSYGLILPETLSHGPFQLWVGLYDPTRPASPRLLIDSGADSILLAEFPK